ARGELARDAKDFLLLEYLVLLPALVCLAVQAFGFITATVVHGYARSDSVLTFLILASFFVPQTTIVRNFWMLDRRFVKLAASNVIGLLTHGLGLGGAILINGLSITSIAIGTLIGWAGYYLWMMGTIGRELWGSRSAAGVGLHALLGAGITAGVVALLPALSGHPGAGAAFAQSAWKLLLSLLLVAPLAAYGLRRTGALAHFRQPGAVT
ncbi:MAG: hypothetical protein JO206_07035, partial [Solirubrobacterales bacterium]|nr:hypothetical protein [Solirubrobacterales bacterium]MBV9472707.1 hypothetical protein [Solirubrobacterales bacterium]